LNKYDINSRNVFVELSIDQTPSPLEEAFLLQFGLAPKLQLSTDYVEN
jgi:hypothetical protein